MSSDADYVATATDGFLSTVVKSNSFPIFIMYLLMIPLSKIYQRHSKPLQLSTVMIVYNISVCLINLYCCLLFAFEVMRAPSIYVKESRGVLTHVFYVYWLSKVIELLDTVFMIVRHKSRQISALHVYHHASMVVLMDYSYNFTPWVTIAVLIGINSFIHVMLYFYYAQAALNPNKPPTWKKRMTQMQLLQFFIGMIHCTIGYMYYGFCIYSIFYGISMIGLFSNFYYHAFIKEKSSKSNGCYKLKDS